MCKKIILSPHIDDAIFSLGGKIFEWDQNHTIIIMTIFSQSPFIYNQQQNTKEATTIRKGEDRSIEILLKNTRFIYLDFPEALLRGISIQDIFLSGGSHNQEIIENIRKSIFDYNFHSEDVFYVPIGFGNHIDHVITSKIISGINCHSIYYTDLPYYTTINHASVLQDLYYKKKYVCKANDHIIQKHLEFCQKYQSQIQEKHLRQIKQVLIEEGYIFWENSYAKK